MSKYKYKNLPGMFHRRLIGVFAGCLLVFGLLSAQLLRLSVVEGAERLEAVKERLRHRRLLETRRGAILDRHGRELAVDRASYDVAVRYDLVAGTWPLAEAEDAAVRAVGRDTWNQLGPEARDQLIEDILPHCEEQARQLWAEIAWLGQVSEEILNGRRGGISHRVEFMAKDVWDKRRDAWMAEQERRARARFGHLRDDEAVFTPEAIREQRQTHVVLRGVPDEVAFEFQRLAARLGEGMLEVQDSQRREYPWLVSDVVVDRATLPRPLREGEPITVRVEGVADHLIGAMRDEVWKEDLERRPFRCQDGTVDLGGYLRDDRVGSRGIEQVFEARLRGQRGEIVTWIDTGQRTRTEPRPGEAVQLALDVVLQARIQALLSHDVGLTVVQPWHMNRLPVGTPLNGAAVVLEVPTGEVLAMVSMPTLAMGAAMSEARQDRDWPMANRPTEAVYPPGSILKPLVLAIAVDRDRHRLSAPVHCRGYYFDHVTDTARCWIYRERYSFGSHGDLLAAEALGRSCNIFFYTLADELGMPALVEGLRGFGLGEPLGTVLHRRELRLIEVERDDDPDAAGGDRRKPETKLVEVDVGESRGELPGPAAIEAMRKAGRLSYNTVIMGIGQGTITWTPLQAANAYATLARAGRIADATLMLEPPRTNSERAPRPDLALSPELVNVALEGLRQSVQEPHGTGYRVPYEDGRPDDVLFEMQGVTVWGKTGTAQAPAWILDHDGDGAIAEDEGRKLDHAWFVGLVGPAGARPLYAIAVVVEYGGSGGRVAGPIAAQVIRVLQDEHYLPGGAG